MIELGSISIQDEDSIVHCRNKIRVLAMDLKFSSVEATRLATATSEICWSLLENGGRSSVDVYFDKLNKRFGLLMVFNGLPTQFNSNKLEFLFDQFSVAPGDQETQIIRTFKFFRDPSFTPTQDFIEAEKSKIVQLSRDQLMEKLNGTAAATEPVS